MQIQADDSAACTVFSSFRADPTAQLTQQTWERGTTVWANYAHRNRKIINTPKAHQIKKLHAKIASMFPAARCNGGPILQHLSISTKL